jgi:hypothetical protein
MALLIPNSKISARWNGALQARRQRTALEAFLRSRELAFVSAGTGRDADNIATASAYFIGFGLSNYAGQYSDRLISVQPFLAAQVICSVSDGLARLIKEPACWRVAALVTTGRLLTSRMGIKAAAQLAASAAYEYSVGLTGPVRHSPLCDIRQNAANAVRTNDEMNVASAVKTILRYLSGLSRALPLRSADLTESTDLRASSIKLSSTQSTLKR